jgi:II/X family phage/plasmid replication protein
MIDWFRGAIPFRHVPVNSGHVLSFDANGEVDWHIAKSYQSRGSCESSIQIKSQSLDGDGMANELWIDGNLSKYLQGHNLFGSRDLNSLVYQTFNRLTDTGTIQYFPGDAITSEIEILAGRYLVKAIDINQLYRLDNDRSVEAWLYAAEMHASKRAGRTTSKRGTVYIGQHSRRWAIKFYNKYREMLKNQSPSQIHYERLLGFAVGCLRVELRLLAKELSDLGILFAHQLTPEKISELFNAYIGRIDMKTNATLIDEKMNALPRSVQSTYHLWKSGVACREILSHNTFYRHRRILLELEIDINFPPQTVEKNNVVPMLRVIEAVPVENPNWGHYLNLIA